MSATLSNRDTRRLAVVAVVSLIAAGCGRRGGPEPGTVQDEAMRAGLTAEHFVRRTDDYFNQSAGTRQIRQFRTTYQTVTPVLEMAAGMRYDLGPFFFMSGYEFANWFNLNQQAQVLGYDDIDDNGSTYNLAGGDVSFDGFFFRVGYIR